VGWSDVDAVEECLTGQDDGGGSEVARGGKEDGVEVEACIGHPG
jgi:hypothetical protein